MSRFKGFYLDQNGFYRINKNARGIGWKSPHYSAGNGLKTHIDEGTFQYLDSLGCKSLLDVGCSIGTNVQIALEMGWGAFGIEVDDTVLHENGKYQKNIALIDCTHNPVIFHQPFDVVWSVEVAEHIPKERFENYLETLVGNCGKYLVMTAAKDTASEQEVKKQLRGELWGQHLNGQKREYWIDKIEKKGLKYNDELCKKLVKKSTMIKPYLKYSGMVFEK